jgi:hypothetical protein
MIAVVVEVFYKLILIHKSMAKGKSTNDNRKTVFGKRKGGKAQKSRGPKDKPVSKYRGQGK